MKYSLRSLMTFSIRDLMWLTVVVALALGWWMDKRKLFQAIESRNVELQLQMKEETERLKAELKAAVNAAENTKPNSSAPTPNPKS